MSRSLNAEAQALIEQRYGERQAVGNMAAALGRTATAISVRLFALRQQLRNCIERSGASSSRHSKLRAAMNDFERLEADFFDEGLSPEKALTLAQRLESDPAAASEFLSLYAVDRLLAVKLGPRKPDAVQAILQQIKREQSPFVQDVLRDIRDDLAPRRAAPESLSVGERLKRLVAFPRWALAGATALMAALFAVWFWPTIGEPEIATALQTHVFINGSEPAVEVRSGRRLNAGDVLKTEPGGATTIIFGKEATQIELGPSTELEVRSLARGKHFALRNGKLEATVARQRPFRPLLVRTPQAEARVLGTHFILAADTNATRLEVVKGKVRLTRASDGGAVKVAAGDYAIAATNTELAALPATGRISAGVLDKLPGHF